MGCASSTPMVQTAGSDMLKAATHVADDATKAAEDAVQGVKDSVGKTLETAKETMTTKVEEVKHEVESTLKEKVHELDDAKNALMGKLHLNPPDAVANTQNAAESVVAASKENVLSATEAETKNLKETMMGTSSGTATNETDTVRLARTDTETDSLRTSTPEPEIERALANAKANSGDDDNPPTPIPTYSELENLGNELLHQQHHRVNDTDGPPTNDPLMTAADNMTTTTTTTTNTDTTNTNAMHITPIPIATASSLATAIAATTANAFMGLTSSTPPPSTTETLPNEPPAKSKAAKREEKLAADRSKQQKQIQKLLEEKRPSTTEWEKYADMLALFRKYNPHDALRRGGTLTKFNGHGSHMGAAPIRERRGDDDSSDTTSTWGHTSAGHRASARPGGRLHRPSSASHRYTNSTAARRNSNTMASGRKFDFNPSRSRVNDRGSSSVSSGQNFANIPSNANAYRLSPSFGTQSPTHAHESVKSLSEKRSQHSPLGTYTSQRLESLWQQQPEHGEQQPKARHFQNAQTTKYARTPPTLPLPLPPGGSSMPLDAMLPNIHHPTPLTRESSNTSLSSRNPSRGHIRSYKSSMDLRTSAQLTPLHHYEHRNPPVRNTSSFLTTPRTSPFSITKSYTDLYFSSSSNKENEASFQADLSSVAQQRHVREKSPYKIRDRCEVCCKKYIKT